MKSLDRNAPENAVLKILLTKHLWGFFESAIAASQENGTGEAGARGFITDLHFADEQRQLLLLAYSLWRGVGPAIDIQAIWGMSPNGAASLLAALAVAVGQDSGADLLLEASRLVAKE